MQKDMGKDSSIAFRVGMGTRVNESYNYTKAPSPFYATGFVGKHSDNPAQIKFKDATFIKGTVNSTSIWTSTDENAVWPDDATEMEFFAYAPSLGDIKTAATNNLGTGNSLLDKIDFYNVDAVDPLNNGTFKEVPTGTLQKGYKLSRFYVAKDIDQQVDFITAHKAGASQNKYTSVPLKFFHELCNIELRAFSGSTDYDIEIAGVRIGGAFTGKAIFNFCEKEDETSSDGGRWGFPNEPQRLAVEYIYGSGESEEDSYKMIAGENDETDNIHYEKGKADPIMGLGGNAMVLPTFNKAWAGKANQWISPKYENDNTKTKNPWSGTRDDDGNFTNVTNGDAYFSILVRVTTKTEEPELIYPYPNDKTMNKVMIYKDKATKKIKGNSVKTPTQPDNTDAVKFGWVCVPVDFNWVKGYHYIYTLDFTEGLGIQDPEDPKPGTPILGKGIKFSVTLEDWAPGFTDAAGNLTDKEVDLK